jgi:hypothetical protein
MNTNNIISAPQIADVSSALRKWQDAHAGSYNTFYAFMTTPGTERNEFINSMDAVTGFTGTVVSTTIEE